jgi:hypothetical protein
MVREAKDGKTAQNEVCMLSKEIESRKGLI